MDLNQRMPRLDPSRFSMVPRTDIQRSTFVTTHALKSTFNFDGLYPIYVGEVLPGDVWNGQLTVFARLATPVFPLMDNIQLETFFFYVPNRIVWDNWVKMMGERTNPTDSISYTTPQILSDGGGFAICTLWDYMGLPTVGQLTAGQFVSVNALPLRMYNLIWNEWFRDQNLQNAVSVVKGDGPDAHANYVILTRNKKPDYFTSALPWPLKGGVDVTLPMGGTAPITGLAIDNARTPTSGNPPASAQTGGTAASGWSGYYTSSSANTMYIRAISPLIDADPVIYADLTQATGATINALRLAVQTQRLLERDARGGTRYTEQLVAHWGVRSEDSRLQRPEYIGGGRTNIKTQAIPQTSEPTAASPLGALGAAATFDDQHSFSYHATEHGFILGLVNVTGEITYQNGMHRMWTRTTRYDHYDPVFAHLGEQAIRGDEIYATGDDTEDTTVFGYQERWAEYRYEPSRITGLFKSKSAGTIDEWHVAQNFGTKPTLNSTFIAQNTPTDRFLAAGANANNMEVLFDSIFKIKKTRAMPMFSVPGMMDRF